MSNSRVVSGFNNQHFEGTIPVFLFECACRSVLIFFYIGLQPHPDTQRCASDGSVIQLKLPPSFPCVIHVYEIKVLTTRCALKYDVRIYVTDYDRNKQEKW